MSAPRGGKGRGYRPVGTPNPAVTVANSAVASNASSASSAGTSSARHVLETAATTAKEFVPRGLPASSPAQQWPAAAAGSALPANAVHAQEFVPQVVNPAVVGAHHSAAAHAAVAHATGPPTQMYGNGPVPVQQPGYLPGYGTDPTMMAEFERPYSVPCTTEEEMEALQALDELVHQVLVNPWSLDMEFEGLVTRLNSAIRSGEAMQSICEYLVNNGMAYAEFSYIGSRLIQMLDLHLRKDGVLSTFRSTFLKTLEARYFNDLPRAMRSAERRSDWLNFSMFVAEVYRNLVIVDPNTSTSAPLKGLSYPVLEIVRQLLLLPCDDTVQCVCKILKLSGSFLQMDVGEQLYHCIHGLRILPTINLSKSTQAQIQSVIRLSDNNWGMSPDSQGPKASFLLPNSSMAVQPDSTPYGDCNQAGPANVSGPITGQSLQPVSNPDMWNEYAVPDDECQDEQDLALQRDMEEEYARFLRETEDS